MKNKMNLPNGKKIIKIVLCGDGAVGKTTLAQRLSGTLNLDINRRTTPGLDVHTVEFKEENIFGQVWDLGGQDQFRFFQDRFFRNADIVIFVFSVEWYHSFMNLDAWKQLIPNGRGPNKIYLIANMIDTEDRAVTSEEAMEYAALHNMEYFEVSAIDGRGFEKLEDHLLQTIKHFFLIDQSEQLIYCSVKNAN